MNEFESKYEIRIEAPQWLVDLPPEEREVILNYISIKAGEILNERRAKMMADIYLYGDTSNQPKGLLATMGESQWQKPQHGETHHSLISSTTHEPGKTHEHLSGREHTGFVKDALNKANSNQQM